MSWFRQSYRHSLAAKGIRTSFARADIPYYPQVAMERFDLDRLKMLGQGRDRTTFELENPKMVLKVAHNPTGVSQNLMEVEDIGAKPLYGGKDFVVMQKVRPFEAADAGSSEVVMSNLQRKRLRDLRNILYRAEAGGFDDLDVESSQEERLLKILGLEGLVNYPNLSAADLGKVSSWGVAPNRRMVLLDKGGLDASSFSPDIGTMKIWEDIVRRRKEAKLAGREPIIYLVNIGERGEPYVTGDVWNVEKFRRTGDIEDQWTIRPRVPKPVSSRLSSGMVMFD